MSDQKPSGAQNRKRRKVEGLAVAGGAGDLGSYFSDIGYPPSDPIETIIWCSRMSARCAWVYATASLQEADLVRLRGILDAVRSNGMTSSKAHDKVRLKRIEQRLGIAEEEVGDGLEERASDKPPALRG